MNFTQLLQILRARLGVILAIVVLITASVTAVSLVLPKKYTATTTLVIDYSEPVTGLILPSQLSRSYMATQVDILRSIKVARAVVQHLQLTDHPALRDQYLARTQGRGSMEQWLASRLLENTDIVPSRDSRVIEIVHESTDPAFAAKVANAFARAYIETNLELSIEPARQRAEWLDRQLADLRERVEAAQKKLTTYQQAQGIVVTDERRDLEVARLSSLTQQLAKAQLEAQDARNRARQIEQLLQRGVDPENIAELQQNTFIQALKSKIVSQESKMAELSQRLGRNHPDFIALRTELQNLRREFDREIKATVQGLENQARLAEQREQELLEALEEQKQRVLQLKDTREALPALVRELESAQRAYEAALGRANESTLESRANQTNIAVLSPAEPPVRHSSPRLLLNIALAVFAGLFLGVNAALVLELAYRRVRSPDDIRDVSHVPFVLPLAGARPPRREKRRPPADATPPALPAPDKPIGDILLETGRLKAPDIERILQRKQQRNLRFGEAAMQLKLITEDDLNYALARQFHFPYLRRGEGPLSPELVTAYQPFSTTAERFRALRSRLMLGWFKDKHKTLAVLSPATGEGRSALAANLAIAFAQLGQRTLLIDTDLRAPRQHQFFGLTNEQGLSTVLAGRTKDEAIHSIAPLPNLFVMPAGPLPPNPLELIAGRPMGRLLEALEQSERFDVILLDTPPATAFADAQTIAARAHGALIVARRHHTRTRQLQELDVCLAQAQASAVAAVMTCH